MVLKNIISIPRSHLSRVFLIFLIGFTNNVLPIIILLFKKINAMTTWQAVQLQFIFFICHFLVIIPGFRMIKKIGPEKLAHYATQICIVALLLVGVVIQYHHISLLSASLMLLACGLGLLRVTVNASLINQQKDSNYHQYIMKVMCADTIGSLLSPTIAAYYLLPHQNSDVVNSMPYPLLFFAALGLCYYSTLHDGVKDINIDAFVDQRPISTSFYAAIKNKSVRSGFWMIFIFIGLEFSIPLFIGLIAHTTASTNRLNDSFLISVYWTLILLGRIMTILWQKKSVPSKQIEQGAIINILIIGISMLVSKEYQLWVLCALGFFNAQLYPAIFSLHTKNLDANLHTISSGVFLMGLSGGAVVPYLQTLVGDHFGLTVSFSVIVLCYLALIWKQRKQVKRLAQQVQNHAEVTV